MSGAVLLGVVTLVCVTDLVIALRFLRRADQADSNVGAAPRANGSDPAVMRSFARIMFIVAPLMWLFFVALTFGLLGPVGTITPIKF